MRDVKAKATSFMMSQKYLIPLLNYTHI